jgi:hypothetical protein
MLVVVGLLAIISFVFLGPMMSGMGGPRPVENNNPLILTSDYGDLRRYDVERLRMLQSILYSYLNSADQESWLAKGGDPNRFRPTRPQQVDDQYAIQTFLLAGRAKEMGIVVDDGVILYRLKQLGLSENRLRELLDGYHFEGQPMTTRHLFEAYRTDLQASRVRQAYGLAVPDRPRTGPPAIYTPAESFENYSKLNEQVQIESIAVPTEQFIDQVKDPSPGVLKAFFDKYKDRIDSPMIVGGVQMASPEPGFKQPDRIQFHYLEANYLAYLDLAKQQVTDEEIAKYYEDNKRQFEKLNFLDAPTETAPGGLDLTLPELDKLPGEGPTTPETSTPESSPEAAPSKEGATAAETRQEAPAKEPASKEAAPEAKPEGEKTPAKEVKPAAEGEKQTEEKPIEGEQKPAETEPQSLILDGSKTQFVSFQADAEGASAAQPAAEKPAAEATADEKPAATETKADEVPTSESPAIEQPAQEASAAQQSAPTEGAPPEPSSTDTPEADLPEFKKPAKKPAEETADDKTPASERGKEYKPLEEVAEEIRQTLADQRAGLSMLAAIEPLQRELHDYWKAKVVKKLKEGDEGTPILPEGFLARAEKANMVYHETDPAFLSGYQLSEIPLGQAGVPTDDGASQTKIPLTQYAFSGQLERFQPVLAEGDDGNKYLAWKVGEKTEYVPKLDEVRAEVVRAWKLIEARKLAEAEAKRIAAKAKKMALPLDKALGDEGLPVLFSPPFTWLTRGNVSQFDFSAQSRLSEISGIEGADNDFMKKIFSMKQGEIEVLENFPKSAYYVVRLAQKVTPTDTLRENYLRDEQTHPFLRPWDRQAQQEVLYEVYQALIDEVELDAHVTWHEKDLAAVAEN